ncbi:hypothetical protein [Lysinibacillus sphaericus]|uniref:hypothetical protein n=1 Tax=Lysinibacillus sphaericus TaxID=1421 RepID=UPI0005624904|nr:hypothetical protein [Lysinibacillus sphaericus]
MTTEEWIQENLIFDRKKEEIVFNSEDDIFGGIVIGVKMTTFIDMFGEAIQQALLDGLDVKQAIRDSDPDNELGYNNLLIDK